MKQYNFFKIAVLSSILLIGTTGCEDFLTKDHPTATTDDEFWKTMNECENALGQCRSWPKAGHGGDDLSFVCMEGMTDNMYFLFHNPNSLTCALSHVLCLPLFQKVYIHHNKAHQTHNTVKA